MVAHNNSYSPFLKIPAALPWDSIGSMPRSPKHSAFFSHRFNSDLEAVMKLHSVLPCPSSLNTKAFSNNRHEQMTIVQKWIALIWFLTNLLSTLSSVSRFVFLSSLFVCDWLTFPWRHILVNSYFVSEGGAGGGIENSKEHYFFILFTTYQWIIEKNLFFAVIKDKPFAWSK